MGGPFWKYVLRGACLLNIFVWDAITKFEGRIIQPDTGKLNSHKESSWSMLEIYEKTVLHSFYMTSWFKFLRYVTTDFQDKNSGMKLVQIDLFILFYLP